MPFYWCKRHIFIHNHQLFVILNEFHTQLGRGGGGLLGDYFLFKKCLKDCINFRVSDCTYLLMNRSSPIMSGWNRQNLGGGSICLVHSNLLQSWHMTWSFLLLLLLWLFNSENLCSHTSSINSKVVFKTTSETTVGRKRQNAQGHNLMCRYVIASWIPNATIQSIRKVETMLCSRRQPYIPVFPPIKLSIKADKGQITSLAPASSVCTGLLASSNSSTPAATICSQSKRSCDCSVVRSRENVSPFLLSGSLCVSISVTRLALNDAT